MFLNQLGDEPPGAKQEPAWLMTYSVSPVLLAAGRRKGFRRRRGIGRAMAFEEVPRPSTEAAHALAGETVRVVVRLSDGGQVSVGTYADTDAARTAAEELIATLSDDDATWPFLGGRYLRPDAIVSIDLIEDSSPRWTGSTGRARWATNRDDDDEG